MRPSSIFTEQQAERLTGLSRQTLGRWRRADIFEPTFDLTSEPARFSWAYSFAAAVALRVLATLRRDPQVPIDELRRVADRLSELGETAWQRRLWVTDGRVSFDVPGHAATDDPTKDVATIDISEVKASLDRDTAELSRRDPATHRRVMRSRYLNRNAWTVAGTGVMTVSIRRLTEDGYDEVAILRDYPDLVPADIPAALRHEQTLFRHAA